MRKVLIANRGEIAVRIARACRDAGIASVAVYADADRDALHVKESDEAFALDGDSPATTYLDVGKLLAIAARTGADAVHPGYGFLAENADFAKAVTDAGLIWIGPPAAAIDALGDKVQARHIAQKVGAPLVPGTADPVADADEVVDFAQENGLPVAIKAAYGGGGRGLKVAADPRGDPGAVRVRRPRGRHRLRPRRVLRRALPRPAPARRDAVPGRPARQRRRRVHARLLAAAPPPEARRGGARPVPHRRPGGRAATASSKAILHEAGYVGAGTCEFLVGQDGTISFLEVNTRLQVEHPVTEEVAGVDLVREMFRIADGEPLGYDDPAAAWALGRVPHQRRGRGAQLHAGARNDLRDAHRRPVRESGSTAATRSATPSPRRFDSLIAKLVVTGRDRRQALERSRRALAEYEIAGMATVIPFHRAVVSDEAFAPADPEQPFTIHTRWIETEFDNTVTPFDGAAAEAAPTPARERVTVEVDGKRLEVVLPAGLGSGIPAAGTAAAPRRASRRKAGAAASGDALTTPMQGTIVKIAVAEGDQVGVRASSSW